MILALAFSYVLVLVLFLTQTSSSVFKFTTRNFLLHRCLEIVTAIKGHKVRDLKEESILESCFLTKVLVRKALS